MRIDPEISGASIVLVGDFNPAIFHPAWLFANGVEDKVPEELVKVDVCHKDISRFVVSNTGYLVDADRFQIQTAVAPWVSILDKVQSLFADLLSHTPVRSIGINRDIHFQLKDNAARTKLGRILAPIEPWGFLASEMESKKPELVGGLLSLTMRSVDIAPEFATTKNIRVEPSSQIKGNNSVYLQANFHFDNFAAADSKDFALGARPAIDLLASQFQNRVNEAEVIFDQVMGLV
jgi:hypothetical protein